MAVAVQAFIPGSAAYIAATQSSTIVALSYLYTGEILSSKAAFALLPAFASEAATTTLFLWVKSFLPPTGVVDVAAAIIAVSLTLAILATVNSILESGAKLEEEELLKSKFRTYRKQAETALKGLALTDLKRFTIFEKDYRAISLNTYTVLLLDVYQHLFSSFWLWRIG